MKCIAAISALVLVITTSAFFAQAKSPDRNDAPLTRAEAVSTYTRVYANKTPEQVFDAVSKLFSFADQNKDLAMEYPDRQTMVAYRTGSTFPMHVQFQWSFKVAPTPSGTEITTSLKTAAAGFGRRAGGGSPTRSPSVIELFYTRLDYLLGVSPVWYNCKDFKNQRSNHSILDALCFKAVDLRPDPTAE